MIETPETLREFAPHALPADAVARQLGTSPDGLSLEEARRRLHQFGANEIEGIKPISIPALILHQFASPLIYILLAAAVVTLLLGDYIAQRGGRRGGAQVAAPPETGAGGHLKLPRLPADNPHRLLLLLAKDLR
jgi:hypothetical protein